MIHSKLNIRIFFIIITFIFLGFSHNPRYITESDKYHIVRKGETLYSISKKYNTTVEELKKINGLSSNKILVGQKIYLNYKDSPYKYYVTRKDIPRSGYHIVKKGETLYRISKIYGLSLEDLMDYNKLSSYTIREEQKLWLKPTKHARVTIDKIQTPAKSPAITKTKTAAIPEFHTVKKGETLYRIASQYNLSIYELKNYNSLTSNKIFPGQKIYLSAKKKYHKDYKVKNRIDHSKNIIKYGLIWPCKGTITSPFGIREGKPHKGIDIACPEGTPIKSILDGEVAYSGWQRGYGNVLILKHEQNLMSVYAHNKENCVEEGDRIIQGEKIAAVGSTGNTTGSHVHFEIRIDGRAYDPIQLLP